MRSFIIATLPLAAASVSMAAKGGYYVQSRPSGANVAVIKNGKAIPTDKRTPCLLRLEPGKAVIAVTKTGYQRLLHETEITNGLITRSPILTLEVMKYSLSVTYEEANWIVFANGAAAYDHQGKLARTPSTILLPEGKHIISIVAQGFKHISTPVVVEPMSDESMQTLQVVGTPTKGTSPLHEAAKRARFVGRWRKTTSNARFILHPDLRMHIVIVKVHIDGRWATDGSTITLSWPKNKAVLASAGDDTMMGKDERDGQPLILKRIDAGQQHEWIP